MEKRRRLEQQERQLNEYLRDQTQRLKDQQRAVEEQTELLNKQKQLLDEQSRRVDRLRLRVEELILPPGEPEAGKQPAESKPAPPPAPAQAAEADKAPPQTPVGQAPPEEPAAPQQAADLIEGRTILTRKGTYIVEPGLQYTQSSVTRVALEGFTIIPAITIGLIDVREVDRDTFTASLGLRYGVSNRTELSLKVPFVRREDRTTTRPLSEPSEGDTTTKVDGTGLGDIEGGINYLLNYGTIEGPYYIASLRVKSRTGNDPFEIDTDPDTGLQHSLPTGSGFWGVQPALSISYPSDPAVFYGSLSYLWNVKRDVGGDYGEIDPGDAYGLSFGMALALNQKASFSIGYSHSAVTTTQQNGRVLPGSDVLQVGTLLIGISHRVGKTANLSFGLGVGVTEDAPNVQVSVRLPMGFTVGD